MGTKIACLQPGWESSRSPIQKRAYREGAFFCFSELFLWPLQEPLNHKALSLLLPRIQLCPAELPP